MIERYATIDAAKSGAKKMNAARDAGDPAYCVYREGSYFVVDCRTPEQRLRAQIVRAR